MTSFELALGLCACGSWFEVFLGLEDFCSGIDLCFWMGFFFTG
jgi:hypothetical protein